MLRRTRHRPPEPRRRSTATALRALGLGLGAMYLFDPDTGKRRRALIRDQFVHWQRVARETAEGGSRDLANRARGLAAEARKQYRALAGADGSRRAPETAGDAARALGPVAATAANAVRTLTPAARSLLASGAGTLAMAFLARRARLGRLIGTAAMTALALAVAKTEQARMRAEEHAASRGEGEGGTASRAPGGGEADTPSGGETRPRAGG